MSHPQVICHKCKRSFAIGFLKDGLCYQCYCGSAPTNFQPAKVEREPITTKRVRIVDPIGNQLDDYIVLERGKKRFRITPEELWDLHEKYPEIG